VIRKKGGTGELSFFLSSFCDIMGLRDYYNNPEINSENPSLLSIDIVRENCAFFGIYNNPLNKNGGDVVDDEDELMKHSRELEEDLESDNIPARPQGGSPEETS